MNLQDQEIYSASAVSDQPPHNMWLPLQERMYGQIIRRTVSLGAGLRKARTGSVLA